MRQEERRIEKRIIELRYSEIEMTIYILPYFMSVICSYFISTEVEMTILKLFIVSVISNVTNVHHEPSAMLLNIYIIGGTTSVGLQQLFIMSHLHCYLTCI